MLVANLIRFLFQIALCINLTFSDTGEILSSDTCTGDIFQPVCANPDETALMISAIYGRPKTGKCISQKEVSAALSQDLTYLGCSSDVLPVLHEKCSLKNSCTIKIPDDDLDKTEPCFPGLKLYLHTKYKCIKIINQEQDCRVQIYSTPRYLTSNTILTHSDCGKQNNPWIMETPRGQKIKLVFEMLDELNNDELSGISCREEFGTVIEKNHAIRKNVTLCTNGFEIIGDQREKINTWVSSGSLLEVTFNSEFIKSYGTISKLPMILLKFESDGCLDIIPPEDTWLKRTGDDIVIGCYSSKQTWYLRCENKKWSGTIGNCSAVKQQDEELLMNTPSKIEINEEQQIVLFVAICALGLVICLIIVCVGAICIKRYKWKSKNAEVYNKPPAYYQNGESTFDGHLVDNHYKSVSTYRDENNCEMLSEPKTFEKPEENKYFVLENN